MPDEIAYSILDGRSVLFRDLNRGDGSKGLAVAIMDGLSSLRLASRFVRLGATVTRPSNTTQYAAGEVVNSSPASILTFGGAAYQDGASGIILAAQIVDSANQSTKPTLELWVFSSPPIADNDNALFTPSDTELASLVGIIPFSTSYVGDATSGAGGNCVFVSSQLSLAYQCGISSTSLYGVLVVRNTYTPISDEVFTVSLSISRD